MEKYLTPFQDYSTAEDSSRLCDISGVSSRTDASLSGVNDARDEALSRVHSQLDADAFEINEQPLRLNRTDASPRLLSSDSTAELDEGPLEQEEEEKEEEDVESVIDAASNANEIKEMHLDMLKVSVFLDTSSHLYKRVCPSVGPSNCPSVTFS